MAQRLIAPALSDSAAALVESVEWGLPGASIALALLPDMVGLLPLAPELVDTAPAVVGSVARRLLGAVALVPDMVRLLPLAPALIDAAPAVVESAA